MDSDTYSVGELARAVSRALARSFPNEVWVQGEIRDLSRASSGHVYFTLLDTETDGEPPAVLPVTLFESDKVAVNRVLARSGAVRMTDGVEVRIRGWISHYAARGTVQLRMTWIDTDFTLGRLAAERERLVRSLDKRGLLHRNRAIALPLVPLRVGLITSARSAASQDFLDELAKSGYAWEVKIYDARVQGRDAVGDIVGGLQTFGAAEVDVVALVRGGGAQTDLAAFDNEEIAVAIGECPVPVLTGIGHETDVSVADLVARNFKTPTACAAGLIDTVATFMRQLDDLGVATRRAVLSRLAVATTHLEHTTKRAARSAVAAGARERQRLNDASRHIVRGSRSRLQREPDVISSIATRLRRAGGRQVVEAGGGIDRISGSIGPAALRRTQQARAEIESIDHRLNILDPQRLLARGWSITRTADGTLVLDPQDVEAGTRLRTTVAGGRISSVVDEEVGLG